MKGGDPQTFSFGDRMKETVYMTMKVYKNGVSHIVYLADYLGIDIGDMIGLTFYRMGDACKKVMKLTKRVVKVGSGKGCYIDKHTGITKGDIIIARIDPVCSKGEKDDTRVKTEEGFEGPLE